MAQRTFVENDEVRAEPEVNWATRNRDVSEADKVKTKAELNEARRKADAEVVVDLDEFQKILRGLRNKVQDMQLRREETKSFNDTLDRLEAAR